MATPTEAIAAFLNARTHSDLAELYNYSMEVQVVVSQDGGDRVESSNGYRGHKYYAYTDDLQTWKPFRIPWKASTEPEYTEVNQDGSFRSLQFCLDQHAEGIGMTGWDWENQVSKWVAFDFDGIINHVDGLSVSELERIRLAATSLPWVTVRKSTSGSGLHLYVFLDNIQTTNHTEHAALARAVLGQMSAEAGCDFNSKVDTCGGNMWIWHRKMESSSDGLILIDQGEILKDIPKNWQSHLDVVRNNTHRTKVDFIDESKLSIFDELTGQRARTLLDTEHRKLLDYLKSVNAQWWWDNDRWMLVCHTFDLKQAYTDLGLRGIFDTKATGRDHGADHNCFCFPLPNPAGAWVIRRYTQGIQETTNWDQDSIGYTRCYYNMPPTLEIAAVAHSGIEDEKGRFEFAEAECAVLAAKFLGISIQLPPWACSRTTILKMHKDNRLIVYFKREPHDKYDDLAGWREDRGWWMRIFKTKVNQNIPQCEITTIDFNVRHLVDQEHTDRGWCLYSGKKWSMEPLTHVKLALKAQSYSIGNIDRLLGQCIVDSWIIVNQPFQPEFPGSRVWNRHAVQFQFKPKENEPFNSPTWDRVLDHCGTGLTDAIKQHNWCQMNGVLSGGDYLRLWIASLFQYPDRPLPYLFLYSPEEQTGKSTLHEALSLLITHRGYARADAALTSAQAFNAELEHAILCVIEETNLRKNTGARNRLKDWVTAERLPIHAKGHTPYLVPNITHYIQTANDHRECPIFPGDTRITMSRVPAIKYQAQIPKRILVDTLRREASDFLASILRIEIPDCTDRLNIPTVDTAEKIQSGNQNRDILTEFLTEHTYYAPGQKVLYSDLWAQFAEWLDTDDRVYWTKIKFGRRLPPEYPKGRVMTEGGQFYIGNISFEQPTDVNQHAYTVRNDTLFKPT